MKFPDLSEMMETIKSAGRQPLDSIPIPREHVLHFLTLVQKLEDDKKAGIGKAANCALWSYVCKILPYTKGKQCRINITNAWIPLIEVMGELPQDRVGVKGVVAIYPVAREFSYRLLELMDMEENGALHRYNLWTYIASIVPEVAANPGASWAISLGEGEIAIIQKVKAEDDK